MKELKKEQIKDRMVRLAAEHWNIQENEVDANFDPLLILIFDAIANEIESVGYQIKDIQNSLLDELSNFMLPQSLLKATPASCILTAIPNDITAIISKENNFTTIAQVQKHGNPISEVELNFTPIGNVKLFQAQLNYLRVGNKIFKYTIEGKKTLIHDDHVGTKTNTLHFLIQSNEPIKSFEGLQIFFDLKGHSEANNFYFALQNALLSINHQETQFHKGYFENETYQTNLKDALNKEGDYTRKLQKEIAAIYANQFLTVHKSEISFIAQHDFLKDLPEKLVQEIGVNGNYFFTLQLSRPFEIDMLDRLQISINAFPAINRKITSVNFKTDKWVNIIPLPIIGSYLDIETIEGLNGYRYHVKNSQSDEKLAEGHAIIRSARVSKKSSHEVRNTINGLLEAVRDEGAFFSRVSNDFIAARLNEISKTLTRLEDQVQLSKDEKPAFQYVLLKPKTTGERVVVNYWTTQPIEANHVKANAFFKPYQHTFVHLQKTYAVTAAVGGKDNYSDYAQKQILVRQLSSRGKIISIEDVKLLCYELFGKHLRKVTVEKKMHILQGTKNGISRVIFIHLQVDSDAYAENELVHLEKLLHYQLDTQSTFVYPFEILVTKI